MNTFPSFERACQSRQPGHTSRAPEALSKLSSIAAPRTALRFPASSDPKEASDCGSTSAGAETEAAKLRSAVRRGARRVSPSSRDELRCWSTSVRACAKDGLSRRLGAVAI
eukprot:6712447-Prymnesium_polylepis.1